MAAVRDVWHTRQSSNGYSHDREEQQGKGVDEAVPPGRRKEIEVEHDKGYDICPDTSHKESSCEFPLCLPCGHCVSFEVLDLLLQFR